MPNSSTSTSASAVKDANVLQDKESTKSENLTERLVEAIVQGEILPGDKISEPELAKQYEVSRGPLREASCVWRGSDSLSEFLMSGRG